jgi:hypothetical protein
MIKVVEQLELAVPQAVVWTWMSDLAQLIQADPLHVAVHFETAPPYGVGTRVMVDHNFGWGQLFPRLLRVTHWEPLERISWVEIDPKQPRYNFPHSEHFRLRARDAQSTLIVNEVRGSLNSPWFHQTIDALAQRLIVRRVVRHQNRVIARTIPQGRTGA